LAARARGLAAAAGTAANNSESGARYGMFVSFENGIGELVAALEKRLREAAAVHTETTVTRLVRDEGGETKQAGGWLLSHAHATGGEETTQMCDAVVLALPSYAAADLLDASTAALASDLRAISYASSVVVVSGHRLADIAHPLQAFGMVVPAIENRQVLAVSFSSRKFDGRAPDGEVLLRTFIGGALQPELCALDDAGIEQLVKTELGELLGVGGKPVFMRILRYPRAMPQYHLGHLDRVAAIEARIDSLPGLALAGNAYRGVGIPDCVHSGECAAERVVGYS
jgi:oxygen-dependent protoporphyrinogen oxidase